jgi:hypothetical protein
MERAAGIEPAWPAWKAGTLPLSYARLRLVDANLDAARGDLKGYLRSAFGVGPWVADAMVLVRLANHSNLTA